MVVEDFYKINRKKCENISGKTLSVPVLNDKKIQKIVHKKKGIFKSPKPIFNNK